MLRGGSSRPLLFSSRRYAFSITSRLSPLSLRARLNMHWVDFDGSTGRGGFYDRRSDLDDPQSIHTGGIKILIVLYRTVERFNLPFVKGQRIRFIGLLQINGRTDYFQFSPECFPY